MITFVVWRINDEHIVGTVVAVVMALGYAYSVYTWLRMMADITSKCNSILDKTLKFTATSMSGEQHRGYHNLVELLRLRPVGVRMYFSRSFIFLIDDSFLSNFYKSMFPVATSLLVYAFKQIASMEHSSWERLGQYGTGLLRDSFVFLISF